MVERGLTNAPVHGGRARGRRLHTAPVHRCRAEPAGAVADAMMGFSQGAMISLFAGLRRAVAPPPSWRFPGRWSRPSAWWPN